MAGQELSKSRNLATSRRLVLLSDFGRNGQNAALPLFRSEFQRSADEARKVSESPGIRGLGLAPVQQVIAGSGTRKTIKAYDTERLATRW